MNTHPTIKAKKERTGWGKWSMIYTRICRETGKEFRIIKNWHGPAPCGAIACPHCGKFTDLA